MPISSCRRITFALGSLAVSTLARAETTGSAGGPDRYHLVFQSERAVCSPAADSEFRAQLQRRAPRLRPASGSEPAHIFMVEVTRRVPKVRGQLVIRTPDGDLVTREIEGDNCAEVTEGLAFIGALAVEPDPFGPPLPTPSSERSRDGSDESTEGSRFAFGLGTRVLLSSGVLPGAATGLGGYIEVGQLSDELWSPMLRLSAQRSVATRSEIQSAASAPGQSASAEFETKSARLALCPVRWSPFSTAALRPCPFVEVGELAGIAYDVVDKEPEQSLLLAAAGLEIGLEIRPVGPLALGLELGMLFPFRRDAFYLDPEGPGRFVHRVAAVGFGGGIGAGLLFF